MPDHPLSKEALNFRTGQIVDAAIKVHSVLGPGLLESAYRACLAYELRIRGFKVDEEVLISIVYGDMIVPTAYRTDLVVEDAIVVELKAVETLIARHEAQLQTHLKFGGFKVGLLFNFNEAHLKDGIRRRVNGL